MHLTTNDHLSAEAFIRLPEVMRQTALGRATIYARVKAGRFPAPHKLTERASGWLVSDVRAWKTDPLGWRPERVRDVVTSAGNAAGMVETA